MTDDGDVSPRADGVLAARRELVVDAMVVVIAERGYAGTSIGLVCAEARISRSTFYELFGSFEECFLAILDRGLAVMRGVMSCAFAGEEDWLDGLLAAEAAVLTFLDSEPQLAWVLMVEALGAGSWAFERRQEHVEALRALIVEQLGDSPVGGDFPPLASMGVMASLMGLVQDHLLRHEPEPLISLLGPFMGVITAPYLPPGDVGREIRRGEELAEKLRAEHDARSSTLQRDGDGTGGGSGGVGGDVELPAMLRNVRARRARQCVLYLAEQGRRGFSPSNRQVAAAIGILNEGQISGLLLGLERCGVLSKLSYGPGKPNAWRLTSYGEEIAVHFELRENG